VGCVTWALLGRRWEEVTYSDALFCWRLFCSLFIVLGILCWYWPRWCSSCWAVVHYHIYSHCCWPFPCCYIRRPSLQVPRRRHLYDCLPVSPTTIWRALHTDCCGDVHSYDCHLLFRRHLPIAVETAVVVIVYRPLITVVVPIICWYYRLICCLPLFHCSDVRAILNYNYLFLLVFWPITVLMKEIVLMLFIDWSRTNVILLLFIPDIDIVTAWWHSTFEYILILLCDTISSILTCGVDHCWPFCWWCYWLLSFTFTFVHHHMQWPIPSTFCSPFCYRLPVVWFVFLLPLHLLPTPIRCCPFLPFFTNFIADYCSTPFGDIPHLPLPFGIIRRLFTTARYILLFLHYPPLPFLYRDYPVVLITEVVSCSVQILGLLRSGGASDGIPISVVDLFVAFWLHSCWTTCSYAMPVDGLFYHDFMGDDHRSAIVLGIEPEPIPFVLMCSLLCICWNSTCSYPLLWPAVLMLFCYCSFHLLPMEPFCAGDHFVLEVDSVSDVHLLMHIPTLFIAAISRYDGIVLMQYVVYHLHFLQFVTPLVMTWTFLLFPDDLFATVELIPFHFCWVDALPVYCIAIVPLLLLHFLLMLLSTSIRCTFAGCRFTTGGADRWSHSGNVTDTFLICSWYRRIPDLLPCFCVMHWYPVLRHSPMIFDTTWWPCCWCCSIVVILLLTDCGDLVNWCHYDLMLLPLTIVVILIHHHHYPLLLMYPLFYYLLHHPNPFRLPHWHLLHSIDVMLLTGIYICCCDRTFWATIPQLRLFIPTVPPLLFTDLFTFLRFLTPMQSEGDHSTGATCSDQRPVRCYWWPVDTLFTVRKAATVSTIVLLHSHSPLLFCWVLLHVFIYYIVVLPSFHSCYCCPVVPLLLGEQVLVVGECYYICLPVVVHLLMVPLYITDYFCSVTRCSVLV